MARNLATRPKAKGVEILQWAEFNRLQPVSYLRMSNGFGEKSAFGGGLASDLAKSRDLPK